MEKGSSLPVCHWPVLVLVALLGFAVLSATAIAGASGAGHAVAAKTCKKSKKKKCKKRTAPAPVVQPTPTPLSDAEVKARMLQKANEYCDIDPSCSGAGYYLEHGLINSIDCPSKTTYVWSCYGWKTVNDEGGVLHCDFREIVERDGLTGIKSHQDLSYYAPEGWSCFLIFI